MATKKMLTASYRLHSDAAEALDWLHSFGYEPCQINVLMSDSAREKVIDEVDPPIYAADLRVEGMATGGAIGTAVGAVLGAIAATGTTIIFPGFGIVLAGPIVAAFAGGGAGAITGGIIGGFVGMGIPESNARAYEEVLREGGVIVGVVPKNDSDGYFIREYFKDTHAENIIEI